MPPANTAKSLSKLLTIDEVGKHCQVSSKTVRNWILSGDLVAHKLGRQYRISEANLALFLTQNQAEI